ncbi:MAG: glycosyltransferase involved in cell wall biosynthesis [Gammaproteobacteria bacterium]|jgi:glycosyltransferase involved in cell wall biosynthesis
MHSPSVSVVMATKNRSSLLPMAIESVRTQTFDDWELILVDDVSDDDTPEVIARYLAIEPRIRAFVNRDGRHCAGGAKSFGIDQRRGRFIAFLDDDDEWLPHHLTSMLEFVEANPDVDWVFGDYIRMEQDGTVYGDSWLKDWVNTYDYELRDGIEVFRSEPDNPGKTWRAQPPASLGASVVRADIFSRVEMRPIPIREDLLLACEAIFSGATFAFDRSIHFRYRMHAQNTSLAANNRSTEYRIKTLKNTCEYFDQALQHLGSNTQVRRAIEKDYADHLVWQLGYSTFRANGMHREAVAHIWQGIRLHPSRLKYWKALLGAILRR